MNDLWDATSRRLRDDLLARQDAWIQEQADARGMTVEELAEVYYLEYEPLQLNVDETDWILRATQEVRLRSRDKHAEIVGENDADC